jgi:hypothetical protein
MFNFLVFSGMLALVVLFRIKFWDFPGLDRSTLIVIFCLGSAYCGLCKLMLTNQRRSLAYQTNTDAHFYNATLLVEEIVTCIV